MKLVVMMLKLLHDQGQRKLKGLLKCAEGVCILCLKYPSPTATTTTFYHLPHSSAPPRTYIRSATAHALTSTGLWIR